MIVEGNSVAVSHAKATENGVVVETFNVGRGSSSSADARTGSSSGAGPCAGTGERQGQAGYDKNRDQKLHAAGQAERDPDGDGGPGVLGGKGR